MTPHSGGNPGIVKDGEVLFIIRRADFRRAIRELESNCKGFKDVSAAHLLVSEYAVTIRSVGMESEYPVNGIAPGTVQVPIAVLRQIVKMRQTKELAIHVQEGAVASGTSTVRHPAIHLSSIPDVRVSIPIDASAFDLLVVARLLDKAEIERQGLTDRIASARRRLERDVALASAALSRYHVGYKDVEALIDRILKEAEPELRSAIYAK